ncbi:MAG: hypothetical protein Q8Q32_03265 [bacterium]|nr:hypothetical protein [bacterium]
MARRKAGDENTRKLFRTGGGNGTVGVTLSAKMVRQLRWQEGQQVTVSLNGKKLVIEDWKK